MCSAEATSRPEYGSAIVAIESSYYKGRTGKVVAKQHKGHSRYVTEAVKSRGIEEEK